MKAGENSRKKVTLLAGGIFLFFVATGLILLFWFDYHVHNVPSDKTRREDMSALSEGGYEAVILSMYTPESFDAEEFGYFCGIPTVQAFHSFVNLADMGDYLQQGFVSNDSLSSVYIGLDPFEISRLYGFHAFLYAKDYEKYLSEYVRTHSNVVFRFLIPAYSLDYMRSLSDNEFTELIESYRNLVNIYKIYDNVVIYYLGYEEWLITNHGNYVNPTDCEPSLLRTTVAYTIRDDAYALTPDNMEERLAHVTELVQDTSVTYPDLSQWCMVFFGDSIFEYNTGSRSVPGVVEALSGAQVYNCSRGGAPASEAVGTTGSFNRMVTCFLEQDTVEMGENINFSLELKDFINESHEGKRYCFVLNYGLNDYYTGHPVKNPADNFDVSTYEGALRTGISTLKEAYPEALILLLTPTYTTYFSQGTEIMGEKGGILTDYVEAAVSVSKDMDIICINNYADSGINKDTQEQYLVDGCHPNETGALLLGKFLLDKMEGIIADEK